MKTSYEGCNKEIAKALMKGQHIKCKCNGNNYIIIAYVAEYDFPYVTTFLQKFNNATPLPKTETRVIDLVLMMESLIDSKYDINVNGDWIDNSGRHAELVFRSSDFFKCGKIADKGYMWKPWMLEGVEI